MIDILLDYLKRLLKSRLFPITIIYVVMFAVIVNKLFILQIVEGQTIAEVNEMRYVKTRDIKATRGNIYDRKGKLLASNVLSYSIVMEDSNKITSNAQRNAIIHKLVQIIEKNGDTLDTEFYIRLNDNGELEFTVSGTALDRFKKNAYTYALVDGKLTQEQKEASAKDVYEFLKNGTKITPMFGISDKYSMEEVLKIMSVRYALLLNYPKYAQITIASGVSDETVAAVEEYGAELLGVEVQQQTHRVYEDSLYFAHIIGYTGLIGSEELERLNADSSNPDYYDATDMVGKLGFEKKFEKELGGTKGTETVSTNAAGKVVDVISKTDPVAGSDIYLTIDSDLQRNSYHLLEKEIAAILLSKIVPTMNYGSKGTSAADITIPIYEVYYALINNNIINIKTLNDKDASTLEKDTYQLYLTTLENVFSSLDTYLDINNTVTNNNTGDTEDYLDRFYSVMSSQLFISSKSSDSSTTVLSSSKIDSDPMMIDYKNDKVSLSKLIQYALANNWIDLSKLGVGEEYYSAEELYQKLVDHIKNILKTDDIFNKLIYRSLVFSYKLSGTEICLLLFDQGVLEYNEDEFNKLKNGYLSSYDFIIDKIKKLEITPAMLALQPCSGSLVITDVKSGDVLAMVTYPGYDNNKFAGKVDYNYFMQLQNDKSLPLNNRPVSEKTAPGSTFKMVTAFAALEEGVVGPNETIRDLGIFEKINPPAKCHIYPGSHGSVDIADALKVSCNYFFYEMGYRLSFDGGKFNEQLGLSKLAKYAKLFGLDQPSGIELSEAESNVSDKDSVRSSIGQGTNVYTPMQLSRYITTLASRGICYNLTLLDRIVSKDGTVTENSAEIDHELTGVKDSTWNSVYNGMYKVVNESGGSVYNLFHNFGVTVAGKTGTSQISKVSPNNALFLSFAPYEDPEIAVTAVIPNGYTSSNAAELSKNVYKLYYNLDDTDELLSSDVSLPSNGSSTGVTE